MTITIYESADPKMVILESKRDEFINKYGRMRIVVFNFMLADKMREISAWANNELNEECLFEIG